MQIIYLKESAKYYIKGKFVLDVISNLFFIIIINQPRIILDIIIAKYINLFESEINHDQIESQQDFDSILHKHVHDGETHPSNKRYVFY